MLDDIKKSLIASLLTFIITLMLTWLVNWMIGNQGEIIYSSILKNEYYINNIMIKNMQKSEYLKKIDILIDDEINVIANNVYINGKETEISNNTISVKSLKPKDTEVIHFITNKRIKDDDLFLVKNEQRIEIENFNKKENLNIYIILLILFYCIVNFLLSVWSDFKAKKRNEETNKKLEIAERESQICTKKISELIKEEKSNKIVYLKEMNDMEKELKFYQQIILKCCNKEISKAELENLISRGLKTFSKKKIKNLSYSDIYKIVNDLSKENVN